MPNANLTENPLPRTTNPYFCCNAEAKAYKRVLPASTILKKNYFTSTYQKLYNRCQTFQQREFNFFYGSPVKLDKVLLNNPSVLNKLILSNIKPGSPLSNTNMYVANCSPSTDIQIAFKYSFINKILTGWKNHDIINSDEIESVDNDHDDETQTASKSEEKTETDISFYRKLLNKQGFVFDDDSKCRLVYQEYIK
jgi:hypothetical protein